MTTHIFYFKDHFSNGKCHLNGIGIDAFRHSLEERLHEPPSHVETLFCIRFPIRDLSMRIRWDGSRDRSQSEARFAFVLFQMCPMSISQTQRLNVLHLTLTHGGTQQI